MANPLNDGQEPTELLPNQDVEPKQMKQNGVSLEFRRVVQEETEQFMLQSSSQQVIKNNFLVCFEFFLTYLYLRL